WELLLPAQMGYRYLHASGYTGYQGPSEVVSHGVEVLFGLEVLYWLEDGGAFDLRASMGYTHFFGEDAQWFFGNPTLSVGAAF
ncbi:MAG: hypothetical protein CO108_05220, partial [Deltaproteobacteria bacterium CG_4_9_14_3_um_filter_63_12]